MVAELNEEELATLADADPKPPGVAPDIGSPGSELVGAVMVLVYREPVLDGAVPDHWATVEADLADESACVAAIAALGPAQEQLTERLVRFMALAGQPPNPGQPS